MFHSSLLEALALTESPDRRERIRDHIRMVMEQLEEVLTELKDVARELREVVAQIDKLTADIDLDTREDTEEHKMTLACSNAAEKQESGLCQWSCGDLPALNGPTGVLYSPKASWLFHSGKMHCSDKTLYHALCCDDDELDEENGDRGSSRFSSSDSVFLSSPSRPLTPRSARKWHLDPSSSRAALRNSSTQTVSDKSTQTLFPCSPRQRASSDHKH
ncbi:inhibitory synaptic factor 1 isoform X2 [Electrophorus electricus]|uniref:inhibitory synaptic factor 1 isoform X2 n=1 Tax=Electrophorus electricus TaxID=8005 RepID=UPI0015D0A203|nr:inhibitory synaptic factor 1 isoform X2 [Electrophorus electricus]